MRVATMQSTMQSLSTLRVEIEWTGVVVVAVYNAVFVNTEG